MQVIAGLLDVRAQTRPVAIVRIGVGAATLCEALITRGTLLRLADPTVIKTPWVGWTPEPTQGLALMLTGIWVLSSLAFMLGWRSRISGSLLAATLAAVLFLDQQLYSNHLYLMVLVTALLTLADSGAAVSLDARRGRPRSETAGWLVWLLRLQVSIVYGFAALSKLNLPFLSGSVIASSLRREGLLAIPADSRSAQPMLVLSVLAICLEALVAMGLWSNRWRPAAVVGGLALHVGITVWLLPTVQLLIFSMLMLPMYVLFLPAVPGSLPVVWDDSCGFCAGWVRWFRRLDWLGVLRFVPRSGLADAGLPVSDDDAVQALQLVTRQKVHAGFQAVARVAAVLPVSFLWAPLLRLPPVAAAGASVYRRVAARRTCAVSAGTLQTTRTGADRS